MNDLRLLELAAQVVAWHNRHPLARRIGAEHVHSMGYVVLPFVGPAGGATATGAAAQAVATALAEAAPPEDGPAAAEGPATTSLRERAMARAQQGPGALPLPASPPTAQGGPAAPVGRALKRGFTEDFIAPLSPRRVARWAARHGVVMAAPRHDAPVRRIDADPRHDATRLTERWVLTAQVQTGHARSRVLVGPGTTPAVLGHRLWSPARVAGLAAMVGAVVATVAALGTGESGAGAVPLAAAPAASVAAAASAPPADWPAAAQSPSPWVAAPAASAPATAASDAAVTRAAPETPASAPIAAPPQPPAPPPATATAAATPTPGPVDVEPTLGRIELPSLGPIIDERRRNQALARDQAAASAAAARAAAAAPRLPLLQGPAFAVTTRLLRTRAEGEQVAEAMRALLVPPGSTLMHVDLLPAGADWRVVGWPYPSRAQADKARALLAARGMRVEIIDF